MGIKVARSKASNGFPENGKTLKLHRDEAKHARQASNGGINKFSTKQRDSHDLDHDQFERNKDQFFTIRV